MSNPNDNMDQQTENNTAAWRTEILRQALPDCQPQEGSPPNTFTCAENEKLQPFLSTMQAAHRTSDEESEAKSKHNKMDILQWPSPNNDGDDTGKKNVERKSVFSNDKNEGPPSLQETPSLDWHGAPRFATPNIHVPRQFRQAVREGRFTRPTNGECAGFLQCNLVILPPGQHAFDFLLFCQRNPKACPLIEVCEPGSPCPLGVAPDADLRTDVPKYAIYRNGVLEKEVPDITDYWPEGAVAFLIGCSFSYDGPLMDAGIPLRSFEAGKNVPMFKTSLKCRSAGSLSGNMVVSMKPIPALQIAKHVEITSKFPHAHGGPVCVGCPETIGIKDMSKPDWGEAIEVRPDELPVFHACGVTPQSVLVQSNVPYFITHSAGHMFCTDLPSDMNV